MATGPLQDQGWHLTEEGIAECVENGNKTTQAIIKAALDTDLRQIGEKYLPDEINKGRVDYIEGPCILQMQKIRNVSAPKEHEESQGAPRLLKLTLTDGHNTCYGVEIETIQTVSLMTPPGTKIQFSGTIPIENGFLQLNGRNTKSIGGKVEKLLENWELKRRMAKQHRLGILSEGGPPPFVPFGHRMMIKPPVKSDNFKSLETAKEKKESEEFEMQRRATIAEAIQAKEEKKTKSFGSNKQALNDKDVAHLVEMGFATEHACQALRQTNGNVNDAIVSLLGKSGGSSMRDGGSRGYANNSTGGQLKTTAKLGGEKPDKFQGRERKGRKRNEEKEAGTEDVTPSRPSGPATLFDFLETKIPLKEDSKSHNDRKTSDFKRDPDCDRDKFDVDGRQNSDGRKGAGNRRSNLPPRLSGKSSSNSTGQNQGNSGNYTSNSYSSGPGYNNSGDGGGGGGGGNSAASLPFSKNAQSGYGANNGGHDYTSANHNQQQNRYSASNSDHSNYANSNSPSVNNCGVIGNHQQQGSGNYHNASAGTDSGHGASGTTHGSNHTLSNSASSHYNQSQHRYNNNNNNNSTSVHNNQPAYPSGYHGDSRANVRSSRNFSNNPGQVQTATQSSNYYNVSQSQPQQHYTNESHSRYSSYNNPKDFHPQTNTGSDNPNKNANRDYQNHQQKHPQFSASMKQPRKVLGNMNPADPAGNESRHFTYAGAGGGRSGHNYNSTSRPKGGGESGGANRRRQTDSESTDYKYHERKNHYTPNAQPSSPHWRQGDHCLAKYWEDKKFYPAVIESVPDLPTCVVTFIEYGNTEEVMLTDIKPIPKNWNEISKPNSNSRGKTSAGHQGHPGFPNAGMVSHSGAMMSHHAQQMNAHPSPMTATAVVAAVAAAAAQQQMAVSNSQYSGEQLMVQQGHFNTMEFRRGAGSSQYARQMQQQQLQQQQQQMILMQEKMKPTQPYYMPPPQRVIKQ